MAWFPVHCTSINNTNTLISGDNKGTAAQLLEKWGAENASSPFIAAFAQANVGDTSPNTQGAFCLDTSMCQNPSSLFCNAQTSRLTACIVCEHCCGCAANSCGHRRLEPVMLRQIAMRENCK